MLIYSYKRTKCLTNQINSPVFVNSFNKKDVIKYDKINYQLWDYFNTWDYHAQFGILALNVSSEENEFFRGGILISPKLMSRHIFQSYSTLCKFNNMLTYTYIIDDNLIEKMAFLNEYLTNNADIKDSIDTQCRNIYEKLELWYQNIKDNPNCLDNIKWEVAKVMKYYEKMNMYKLASINLKRNNYDFVVE